MSPLIRHACCFVAVGTAAMVVGGCSSDSETTTASTKAASTGETSKQHYLDSVNSLCDKLLPEVVRVTHGGSIDIPARQYLKDWPAHRRVLADFDTSLAAVPVPASAIDAAAAMHDYIRFADGVDAARLKAAKRGERAWRRELAAETSAAADPSIAARAAAGFANSCDAR